MFDFVGRSTLFRALWAFCELMKLALDWHRDERFVSQKKLWRLHQNPVNFWANIHIMIILCVTLMQSILWRFKFRQLFNQQPGPLGWSARPTQLASVLRSKPHCDGSSYHHWIGFVGKICYKRWILPSNMVKHGFCNQIWGFPACFSLKP